MAEKSDPICDAVGNDLNAITNHRLETLAASADIQVMARSLLEHEARRIETKLGGEHPRARLLRARLDGSLAQINTLAEERERVQIRVPEVANDDALIHGRVVDNDRRGIADLMVCLTDANSKPIRSAGEPTTSDTGYFAFVLNSVQIKRLNKEFEAGVFLAAFDPQGELLSRQPKPLAFTEGTRLVTEITLTRMDVIPHEPAPEPVPVPDLIEQSEDTAIALLKRVGLEVGERKSEPVDDPDKLGRVLAQDPEAGTPVQPGSAVNMVVGALRTVPTPDVIGIAIRNARAKIKEAGLTTGEILKRVSETPGQVMQQDPEAGTQVPLGGAVNLVVGRAKPVRPDGA